MNFRPLTPCLPFFFLPGGPRYFPGRSSNPDSPPPPLGPFSLSPASVREHLILFLLLRGCASLSILYLSLALIFSTPRRSGPRSRAFGRDRAFYRFARAHPRAPLRNCNLGARGLMIRAGEDRSVLFALLSYESRI